jgi:hypothetical protein
MRDNEDDISLLEMRLPSGDAVRLGDVVDLAPEVGDPLCEKRAVVVRMLPEDNQVMLLSMGGTRLTVTLDAISNPLRYIPPQDLRDRDRRDEHPVEPSARLPSGDVVTVGAWVALTPEASTTNCGHAAVVETVDRDGLTVLTTGGCRLRVYPYEVKVPDWGRSGESVISGIGMETSAER